MTETQNCSAILCVLNEVDSVSLSLNNLEKLGLCEVIVVDGGSTDGTLEILRNNHSITLIELPREGLLRQRLAGIAIAQTDFVLLVDVDDTIEARDFEQNLNWMKNDSGMDGVQFRISAPNGCFWEKGWSAYFDVLTPLGKNLKLLGRPSIAKRANFHTLGKAPKDVFGEDTWIYLQEKSLLRNYRVGPGISIRSCPKDRESNFLQFKRYGNTDAELCSSLWQHITLLFHSAFRIAIVRSTVALFRGNFAGFIFIFLLGTARTTHHFRRWIRHQFISES